MVPRARIIRQRSSGCGTAQDRTREQLAAIESRELPLGTGLHREQRQLTPEVVHLRGRAVGRELGRSWTSLTPGDIAERFAKASA